MRTIVPYTLLVVSLLLLSKSNRVTNATSPELQARVEAAITYRNSPKYIASRNNKQLRLHTLRERIYFVPSCHKRRTPDPYVPPYPRTFAEPYHTVFSPTIITSGSRTPMSNVKTER